MGQQCLQMRITGSLVLYRSSSEQFERAINSFLAGAPAGRIWIVDNSPAPLRSDLFSHPRVSYLFAGENLGFGKGHNCALRRIAGESDLHVFLNPDVEFGDNTLPHLVGEFRADRGIVAGMPRILYPDGSLQRLCKLLPTPLDLIVRRFVPIASVRRRIERRYELHELPQERSIEVPIVSGCFLVARSTILGRMNGFDERFFMYMEDFDLVRRLAGHGKVVYMPGASATHSYAKGSYRSIKLLGYHMYSALQYFNKWGWFIDKERSMRNRRMLRELNLQGGRTGA